MVFLVVAKVGFFGVSALLTPPLITCGHGEMYVCMRTVVDTGWTIEYD